jgi:two-component system, NtrC family, sensor kinase
MKCPRCQRENLLQAKFCPGCGTPSGPPHGHNGPAASYAELQRALSEALEQQTATSEILRVIGSSPTDVQPVFETIADSAMRLLGTWAIAVTRYDGELVSLAAARGGLPGSAAAFVERARPPHRPASPPEQVVLTKRVHHVIDVDTDPLCSSEFRRHAAERGFRSFVAVPLLRGNECLGMIAASRAEMGGFSIVEIALLQTFADQAVIAIENVRLFTELQEKNRALSESLEQQTATADILRVISRSPTEVDPVFDAVVLSAARLCEAHDVAMLLVDGDDLRLAAGVGPLYMSIPPDFRIALTRGSAATRAVVDRATVHIHDFAAESEDEYPVGRELARRFGHRSMLAVPLLRDGVPIGVVCAFRLEVRPFPGQQIALLKTFADQAVIAIENVRLFKELEARNRDLTEALGQQTATSDILRVISQSQTEVQPVFDAILSSGVRLCGARFGGVFRFDGELIHLVASYEWPTEQLEVVRRRFPMPPGDGSLAARAIRDRRVVQAPDHVADSLAGTLPKWAPGGEQRPRSTIAIPMLRDGNPVGAIVLARAEAGFFSDQHIALLETFADQAVIAIENVRLFKELEARTADLTRSIGELRALGEVGQAVSSTLDLDTVLNTIVSRATELAATDGGAIYEYDDALEQFQLRAEHGLAAGLVAARRQVGIRKGEGAMGRLAVTREPIQINDIAEQGAYAGPLRGALLDAGIRSLLAVPLLREDRLIGGLVVNRKQPGEFMPEVIALLETFATQSALAIQNARLFREIEVKSRQLEAASQHKSEFLANMSHELRTPLNAVIGFSEVLRERMFGELNDKQEEYLNDIHASGQHLLSLINDILDLSKIEAGRMELELTDFHLPAALDNALTLVRERAGRHGIALHAAIDDRIEYIRADERKIKQVLLNLLSNAIKFTPEGGRIEARAALAEGVIEASVTDTGVGIAPEDQEAIFEEFQQVGTAAKKVEGTGLGLALSRKFIELHGGRIWVQSELGAGSTFTFTIPVWDGE